jgi:hypothetical protein
MNKIFNIGLLCFLGFLSTASWAATYYTNNGAMVITDLYIDGAPYGGVQLKIINNTFSITAAIPRPLSDPKTASKFYSGDSVLDMPYFAIDGKLYGSVALQLNFGNNTYTLIKDAPLTTQAPQNTQGINGADINSTVNLIAVGFESAANECVQHSRCTVYNEKHNQLQNYCIKGNQLACEYFSLLERAYQSELIYSSEPL